MSTTPDMEVGVFCQLTSTATWLNIPTEVLAMA